MQQLSAVDAAFLELETPRTPMHVELGRPYWVEDRDFDLDAHVRSTSLPFPGDESALWSTAARILAEPLDLSRPPWQIWVIDGLAPSMGASVALLAKVHHAAVDGLSGMEILVALHDREPRPPDDQPPTRARPSRVPSDLELTARAGTHLLTAPLRLTRLVQEAMAEQAQQEQRPTGARRLPQGAPRTRFNGLVDAERVVDGCSFDGSDLRRLRAKAPGATTNDVALAIVGGALRRHLSASGELPERPLVAMVPSSVRSRTDREGGNRVSAMLVGLGSDIADPVVRLERIATATRRSKQRARGPQARRLIDYLDVVPLNPGSLANLPTWLALSGGDPAVSCVVTNVPLTRRPIYLAGSRLAHVFGSAPIVDGLGLMHVVLTYKGETTICVTSCPTMLPDAHRYTAHLRSSFQELSDAVL
jgi:diacylglycerol O-acyltransferase